MKEDKKNIVNFQEPQQENFDVQQKPQHVLEVKNLSVLIKDKFLVKNAYFSMEKGQCWAVIGENKSGKTSLIKAISGSLPINAGQVFIDGKDVYGNKKLLKQVSVCFDPPVFFKYQSVYENINFLSGLSENLDKTKITKMLAQFGLAHKTNTKVLFLSYYEKKLMALALALLSDPKILLLDEPYKNIPPQGRQLVKDAIQKLKARGTTIIMTSQNMDSIENECTNFILMENREIKKVFSKLQSSDLDNLKTYAFVKVKYPHFAGKLIMQNFDLQVKLLNQQVLFEADESTTASIVRMICKNNIPLYRAGYLKNKTEKIFAELTSYFKEEQE